MNGQSQTSKLCYTHPVQSSKEHRTEQNWTVLFNVNCSDLGDTRRRDMSDPVVIKLLGAD